MELKKIDFLGSLDAHTDKEDLTLQMKKLVESIYSSLRVPLIVKVGLLKEIKGAADWPECGIHRMEYTIEAELKKNETALNALQLSLSVLLANVKFDEALAFLFVLNKNGSDEEINIVQRTVPNLEEKRQGMVASPEDEKFIKEWTAEEPKYTATQWIVSDKVREQFEDALNVLRYHHKVYKEWGFEQVDPSPRSILCFYGPPGTGKSMGAHVVARELGRKILCANYSQIESKYLGEAPKRLRSAFLAAQEHNAVLFFDEADSFFGKRLDMVNQSADQALNSLRSEMFILLENFTGMVVLATNLETNFDSAMKSRISAFVEMELPTAEARRAIIRSKLPAQAPLSDDVNEECLNRLVELTEGLSGRHIKNAMQLGLVKAAVRATASEENLIHADELIAAFTQIKESDDRVRCAGEDAKDVLTELDLSPEQKEGLNEIVEKKIETAQHD